jgi:hypothetical protein
MIFIKQSVVRFEIYMVTLFLYAKLKKRFKNRRLNSLKSEKNGGINNLTA